MQLDAGRGHRQAPARTVCAWRPSLHHPRPVGVYTAAEHLAAGPCLSPASPEAPLHVGTVSRVIWQQHPSDSVLPGLVHRFRPHARQTTWCRSCKAVNRVCLADSVIDHACAARGPARQGLLEGFLAWSGAAPSADLGPVGVPSCSKSAGSVLARRFMGCHVACTGRAGP